MLPALTGFSEAIARLVGAAAPLVCAIRVGTNRHVNGLVCYGGVLVTVDQALPALDSYTVVLGNQAAVQASPGARDAAGNLVFLRTERPLAISNPEIVQASVGTVAVLIGADVDGSPTVRVTVVHRLARGIGDAIPVLDLPAERVDQGSLVMDAQGRLLGLAALGPNGEAIVIPSSAIGRLLVAAGPATVTPQHAPVAQSVRGWLGVSLQPIAVPDSLVLMAGQDTGRLVVSLTKDGPADLAGLRIGDVLLALNGANASGPHAMRAFLGPDRVGTTIRVKFLRDGVLMTTPLTVAAQPG